MNYPDFPTSKKILDRLGPEFVNAYIKAVDAAREDYKSLQTWQPDWLPSYAKRTIACFIHDRIWYHLCSQIAESEQTTITDKDPTREIRIGLGLRLRIKRHTYDDKISNVPTQTVIDYFENAMPTFDGMEEVCLALGYYWIKDQHAIGEPALSFHNRFNEPVWSVKLKTDEEASVGYVSWPGEVPELPDMDINSIVAEFKEEKES
ncbi:hypothetical protein [Corynebacterium pygosceleis]|uniref:hypothetical protein n=1 Tax=Corynebacterium pygosceleis TaxID=2800406 RepID=UPI0019085C36|nr:hypothetical protein [Corynebacterium pygosceleis]MCL0120660.1 hypothetical protein [Corynebacterium pygosceleis]